MKQISQEERDWKNQSISTATYIATDIVDAIEEFNRELDDSKLWSLINEYRLSKDDSILWEDIFDRMNEIAPDGFYFGAHPGNGADFGFWQVDDEEGGDV